MDVVVQKLVALGVPGLVLVYVIGTMGVAGGAAMVAALAALGGPMGMMGGIAVLGLLTLVADAVARHGLDAVGRAVARGLLHNGHSAASIRAAVQSAPISTSLKRAILSALTSGVTS